MTDLNSVDPRILWLSFENYLYDRNGIERIDPAKFGIKSNELLSFNEAEMQKAYLLGQSPIKSWKGFSFTHIKPSEDNNLRQFDVCVTLLPGIEYLDQDILNFLTLKDVSDAILGSSIRTGEARSIKDMLTFDESDYALARAFASQMLAEAAQVDKPPVMGAFILKHIETDVLDEAIVYKFLRLVIVERGIFVSVIDNDEKSYVPFYWTPEGIITSDVWGTPMMTFGLDCLLACLWRDAKVRRIKFVEQAESRGIKPKLERGATPKKGKKIVFPPTIYVSNWHSEIEELPEETRRTMSAHLVKPSYRHVGEGFPDQAALERAKAFRWPAPPPGHTFVSPYKRGQGDLSEDLETQYQEIIWTGKDIAKLMLKRRSK